MNTLEKLRWHNFPVLDKGFVCLVDWMGSDAAVCQAARVSYGAGTNSISDDCTLIRYLMRHQHTTPFEMCEVKLLVRVPMDCWRQWIRHRTASVNEYSTRYSEAPNSKQTTSWAGWRLQSKSNKQGSAETLEEWPEAFNPAISREGPPGEWLSAREKELHDLADEVYKERLDFGVAREQARKDLPLSTYTEAYWKIDLHNLLHFLELRMDEHAQHEIRMYANVIGHQIVAKLFPVTWAAFLEYRLNAMTLSALDVSVLREVAVLVAVASSTSGYTEFAEAKSRILDRHFSNKREREECEAKLTRLGM